MQFLNERPVLRHPAHFVRDMTAQAFSHFQ